MALCLTCECDEGFPAFRGCCPECNRAHWDAVFAGEVTWKDLEKNGLASPPYRRARAEGRIRKMLPSTQLPNNPFFDL